tara:strand:- start:22396 stop:22584 length:189 start_codon:yes stop_codon:yes gene_type:complete
MDWDIELKNQKLEQMIILYEQEIAELKIEKEVLKTQVEFLKEQLEYKTMGLPEVIHNELKKP